ncbi:TPA: phage tail tape measure protein [Pseudomonas aeruginosa]|uniref:phage tail tape measure protein n=2 Tax=Pseudomonas aeruginosa TaxID=287 RepID=UPI00053D6C86|nr:phage tail tape measure protein [Pseudomonas aeruginosa]ALV80612.1 Lambda phage tail tape-measure protein (Tape_meas_lam_C) [Pseudomonas aeruginosa]EKV9030666.1 phage tail tape measure protein [Pseudomonas aeruginosa]EKW0330845.1 phage tail tape measure protein [Pseudomonas aeruginosa]EKW2708157.1 phage tail tape measure protein [Pseudomonas aeruginosa]EKW3861331.1 phage tail tape measure protein [Pseudomonas aeruginosa]
MSDYEVQGMLIQLEATTAQLRRELAGADSVVARTTQNIDRNLAQVDSAFDRTARGAQQAGTLIRGAFAAIAGAGLVGSIIHQVDAYGQIADRLKMATGSTEEYNEVQQHLLRTAQETYRPLAEAQELYIRTADVMRSLGFDTQQTLDITDSFSFLLVTNAASADKASSALGAYSKALQTGKVEADGWVSIQDAMPTIVDAIASATGKSAEEIRKLGVQGKLSLDDINTGLLRTVEVNRKAAADMSVSVQDALVNIQNSITTFAAGIEEGTGALDLLASALGVVANNVEWLAGLVGGALVGALTLYSARAAVATAATLKSAAGALTERNARIAQADAILQAAIAEQRKAQTATLLAEREAIAARGTAVQTEMSIQLAQARQREAAATASVAAAQAGLRTASTGLLAVLGGPMGLALLAGTAAASFLLLRDNADQAGVSLDDLHKPVQQLREEFAKLNRDQREASLVKWQQEQINATDKVKEAYGALSQSIRSAMVTAPARDSNGLYTQQLRDYQSLIERLNQARASGQDLSPILKEVADRMQVPAGTLQQWISQAGAIGDADHRSGLIAETLRVLTGVTQENTAATNANNAAKIGMSSAGQTYLETLQKQLGGLQDNNDAIKAANRFIANNTDLTDTDRQAILSAANAIEAQKKANQAATASGKARTKSLQDEVKALDALIDKALPEKKRLEDLAEGVEKLRKAQAAGKITSAEMELGIKNLNEAYADGSIQKRIQQEQKLAEQRRNSADAYRKAMEVVLQARQDAINSDVAGIGLGDDERDQAQRLDAVRKKYADLRRELEAQQEDASRRLGPAAYEQRLADLADFQARELQMEVDGYGARLDAQRDYRNGARRAWQNIQADAADVASATDDMLTTGFNTASNALADFATTGKFKFRDFASSVINDMARIASQQAATGLLSGVLGAGVSAFSGWMGGSATAGASASGYTGNAYANWAAAQADGGAWANGVQFFANGAAFTNSIVSRPTAFGMAGGRTGIMGEAGPEAILPLARGADGSLGVRSVGGGGGTALQVNAPVAVTVEDRSSEGMELDQEALQQNMQLQMKAAAERAVADSWRPGGVSYRNAAGRG